MSDEGVGIQSVEDFWGVELSSKKKKVAWPADPNDEVEDDLEKTLELRQACLGAKAKEGERNVVQLTAENEEGQDVTHTILSMRVGGAEQTQLFLTLQPPVTFELVSGNGPVHIIGTLNQTLMPFLSDDESSEEEEEEEEEKSKNVLISPEVKGKPALSKKRPAPSPAQKPAKVPKLAAKEEDSEEDSEEEDSEEEDSDDEDEDMETAELAAALREAQAAKNKKQVKGVPREEESDEEEDDESDDEESEEEESEESEEEQPPAKKPQKGKQLAKTPQPNKPSSKTAVPKGSQSAPTTPKTTGGGDKAKKPTAKTKKLGKRRQ